MWVLRLSSLLRKNWAKGKLGNTQFPLIWTWSTSTVPLPQVMGQYYTYYHPSSCFIHIALVFTGWPLSAPVSHPGRRVTLGHHASLAFAWLSHCLTLSLFAVTSTVSRSADWVFCRRSLGWYLFDAFLLCSLGLWSWGSRPQRFTFCRSHRIRSTPTPG